MTALSWASISEQLRTIGVEVPVTAPAGSEPAPRTDPVPPSRPDVPPRQQPTRADKPIPDPLTTILAAAKKAGVTFMERVTDGELVVEGLDHLAPDDRQKLQARWNDVRNELLPKDASTASCDLLAELGIELVHLETEQGAAVGGATDLRNVEDAWVGHRDCAVAEVSAESLAHSRHQRR